MSNNQSSYGTISVPLWYSISPYTTSGTYSTVTISPYNFNYKQKCAICQEEFDVLKDHTEIMVKGKTIHICPECTSKHLNKIIIASEI